MKSLEPLKLRLPPILPAACCAPVQVPWAMRRNCLITGIVFLHHRSRSTSTSGSFRLNQSLRWHFCALVTALLSAVGACGQVYPPITGDVSGFVHDALGNPVPGAL